MRIAGTEVWNGAFVGHTDDVVDSVSIPIWKSALSALCSGDGYLVLKHNMLNKLCWNSVPDSFWRALLGPRPYSFQTLGYLQDWIGCRSYAPHVSVSQSVCIGSASDCSKLYFLTDSSTAHLHLNLLSVVLIHLSEEITYNLRVNPDYSSIQWLCCWPCLTWIFSHSKTTVQGLFLDILVR